MKTLAFVVFTLAPVSAFARPTPVRPNPARVATPTRHARVQLHYATLDRMLREFSRAARRPVVATR
jgi:hypothetical protein